jgi:branched-chain amino acid transport system ATP-binding protein
VLEINDLHAWYGEIEALHGVSLNVAQGEVVAVIGANAAGKTTLINAISGVIERAGVINFNEEDISICAPHEIARRRLVQVPEGRKLFPFMTVRENLELGSFAPHARAHAAENLEKVFALMPKLAERAGQFAGSLSGGEQQMCAIGRALMAMPRAIMFDEPTLGLAPIMVETVFKLVREIKHTGVTILLVEQNAKHALALADRGYVLENGRMVLQGPAVELLQDARLKEAYLGG